MSMSEAAKKKKAQYMRKWRQKPENKEKIKKHQADYWERVVAKEQEETTS